MVQYDFYQDERCTVWHRTYFSIEASKWEEALIKATSIIRKNALLNDDIRIDGSEFLEDTLEALPKEHRPNEPTMEFFAQTDSGDRLIADDIHGWLGVSEQKP